ncbi:protein kinase, partial [bacterium]|nr:protein kinase [bacterium]
MDNDKNADLCLKCGSSLSIKDEISDDEDTIDYNFRPGKKFENFQVIEKIGTGGHGDVYKVKELGTNKIWALKTLTSIKRKSLPRFQQEFRVLSNLEHENIVKVYKYGIYGEMHYYVMEIIDGVDMRKYI